MSNLFHNFNVLGRCFIRFIIKGCANKKCANPQKVLIVQTSKLGDMVCTTPLFEAIKKSYPRCRITVAGNSSNKALLADHPSVDDYIVLGGDHRKLTQTIAEEKFDFACLATPNFRMASTLYLAGIPTVVLPRVINGFCPFQTKTYRLVQLFTINIPHNFGSYVPREYLRLLEPIGIQTDNTRKTLSFSESAKSEISRLFSKHQVDPQQEMVIAVFPSAGNKIKLWHPERFADVINYSASKYKVSIILCYTSSDLEIASKVKANLNEKVKLIDTSGHMSIDALKALISQCTLIVGVDTGPIYIAEALEIPTIDIVGPVAKDEQPPISNLNRVVEVPHRTPAIHIMSARNYDEKEARRQIDEITSEMVTRELDDLVNTIRTGPGNSDRF